MYLSAGSFNGRTHEALAGQLSPNTVTLVGKLYPSPKLFFFFLSFFFLIVDHLIFPFDLREALKASEEVTNLASHFTIARRWSVVR